MYKLVFYVPESHCEAVKEAVFEAGAGRLGNYSHCSWETLGTGQFKPLKGSTPTIGNEFQLERVSEYRVEVLCSDDKIEKSIESLKKSHPYEEPAFDIIKLATI